ncbi:hypothetical protein [Streptomyces sp. NPDC126514]|uniref:hypothetical protein n=1 Tax=Streptomyces sp. NPDC126514 TaxID=3155210 RepID=UPI003319BCCE
MILIEALDHLEAMHAAETAVDLHRPLLAPPATSDVRSSGNTRLLERQLTVNSPHPVGRSQHEEIERLREQTAAVGNVRPRPPPAACRLPPAACRLQQHSLVGSCS